MDFFQNPPARQNAFGLIQEYCTNTELSRCEPTKEWAARSAAHDLAFKKSENFWEVFFKMLPIMVIAGALLIAGYILGYRAFKNIWIVSAISITSILIIEPILAWTTFQQLPTTGALIGLILGAIGLFVSVSF